MKKLIFYFDVFLTLIFCSSTVFSSNEYFRSYNSGPWDFSSTWQMSLDSGRNWIPAYTTPRDTSGVITITHTVTIYVNVSADQLYVGGTISINDSKNLTILDGSGIDLTLNSGGTVSGAGNLKTQGTDITLQINSGSNFNVTLFVTFGNTTVFDGSGTKTSVLKGNVTVNSSATLSVRNGGYKIQANKSITNYGTITGLDSKFTMHGSTLINTGMINVTDFVFDTTTALSGYGTFTSNRIFIMGNGNVYLSGTNVTLSPMSYITISSNTTLNPNTRFLTLNSGKLIAEKFSTVSNSGTFMTKGTVDLVIRNGSNFDSPLKVNTGTTTAYDDEASHKIIFKRKISVDPGASLNIGGTGYYTQANDTVANYGTIGGDGATFIMRGSTLINLGAINPTNLIFDSLTSISGNATLGSFNGNNINIDSTGNVTLQNSLTFAPASEFNVYSGGVINPDSNALMFNSGTFILNNGAIVSGSGSSAGAFQIQGTVNFNFRTGATFNSAIIVKTGILNAYNTDPPNNLVFSNYLTVYPGAAMNCGYEVKVMQNITNNGNITGSGSTLITRGSAFVNNGSVTVSFLNFDTTTNLSGTGSYNCDSIEINSSGNVRLLDNTTFSPSGRFMLNTDAILNPMAHIFTLNSGELYQKSGSTISASGTFMTQGTVTLCIKNGSNFNAPLKVNSGTTTVLDDESPLPVVFNVTVTIDAGSTLNIHSGGYKIQTNRTLTNNGTISGPGSYLLVNCTSLINNGVINPAYMNFDTTTSLSGTGSYNVNQVNIIDSANLSILNNVTFTSSVINMQSGGALNPNSNTFTLINSTLTVFSGASVSASGIFQTEGTVTLLIKNGSSFSPALKINSGVTTCYDPGSPYTAIINGSISVDSSATLSVFGGGYTIAANSNIINNGTISGTGSYFRFYGSNLTNNGIISPSSFTFESGTHNLQGTGNWGTAGNILNNAAVSLASNHQMRSVNISSGGSFNLMTYKLSLTDSDPIINNGIFTDSNATVEYNGTSAQDISTTNVTYSNLRINNSAGTILTGSINISDSLNVILGDLDLNGWIIIISSTGYMTETSGNTVKGSSGYITTTQYLNAPSSLNPGGLGVVLTTAENLGYTEIRRGHAVQNGLSDLSSIARYFDINPEFNTELNAALVFKYDDSELNGIVERKMVLYRSTNSGTDWSPAGGTVNTTLNQITISGLSSFSRWSAGPIPSLIRLIVQGFYNIESDKMIMRDTVRAYLRNNEPPYNSVDSATAVIDSSSFRGSFLFDNADAGVYYIQVKHRNSVETWSKSGGENYIYGIQMTYNFTTDASQAYGGNMILSNTSPVRYSIYSGDVNQDGMIDLSDQLLIYNDASTFVTGYADSDLNGDYIVDLNDILIASNNAASFITVVSP